MSSSLLYKNTSGFSPSIWGPPLWRSIHYIAANFGCEPSAEMKRGYLAFFKSLGNVLPCGMCRAHYKQHIRSGPLKLTLATVKDRKTLFQWTVRLHDAVTRSQGRVPPRPPRGGWYMQYNKDRPSPGSSPSPSPIPASSTLKKK